MGIVTQKEGQNKRYLPHELTTKINSVELYRKTRDINFVVCRYHTSKASLMRWNKQYDGIKESLLPKSHKPHSPHLKAHAEEELTWIRNYHWHNPNISVCELYGKLCQRGYTRSIFGLYKLLRRIDGKPIKRTNPKYVEKPYERIQCPA